jgi:hypothetical protein
MSLFAKNGVLSNFELFPAGTTGNLPKTRLCRQSFSIR